MKCTCHIKTHSLDIDPIVKCSLCESAPDLLEACKKSAEALLLSHPDYHNDPVSICGCEHGLAFRSSILAIEEAEAA